MGSRLKGSGFKVPVKASRLFFRLLVTGCWQLALDQWVNGS
jgi:hypothetical protein